MRSKRRLWSLIALPTVLALMLAACGDDDTGTLPDDMNGDEESDDEDDANGVDEAPDDEADVDAENGDEVSIGVVMPLTAAYGEQAERGSLVAQRMINEAGGILDGAEVELIFEDDQALPEEGVAAFEKLITRDGVNAVTGSIHSSVAIAGKEVTRDENMLHIVTVAKAPDITADGHDLLFRLNSTNDMDAEFFHTWISDELQPETVAVLAEQTDYGEAEVDALEESWEGGSPEIVTTERFEPDMTDFTTVLTNIAAVDADAFYVASATIETFAQIFREADDFGVPGDRILAPGNLNQDFIDLAGEAAEGVISADVYLPDFDNPVNEEFAAEFEDDHGYTPEKIEMLGWEAITIASQAMDDAGTSTDYEAIAEVIRDGTWETPRGNVTFDDIGQATGEEFFPQVVEDGSITRY